MSRLAAQIDQCRAQARAFGQDAHTKEPMVAAILTAIAKSYSDAADIMQGQVDEQAAKVAPTQGAKQ